MEQKRETCCKWQNGGLLFVLCAVGYVVTGQTERSGWLSAAYSFFALVGLPGLMFWLGHRAKEWLSNEKQTICAGAGLLALGYLQKVLLYWAEAVQGKGPDFGLFTNDGVSWIFISAGCYLLFAAALKKCNIGKKRLLAGLILLSLIAGFIKVLTSFFCLPQLIAFAPFFAMGALWEEEKTTSCTAGKKKKLLAAILLAGAAGAVCLLHGKLEGLWGILQGDGSYSANAALAGRSYLGPAVRLVWYLAAFALIWAVLCLAPKKKLLYWSNGGERSLACYFWFAPLSYLAMAPVLESGSKEAWLASLLLCAAGLALSLTPPAHKLAEGVLNGVDRMRKGSPQPQTTLTGGSFYRRHKWAIDMTGLFTACFLVIAVAYTLPFFSEDRSLIWFTDGMGQQYPMMFYFKEYCQQIWEVLRSTGELHFPQWDFTLGFGMSPLDAIRREPFTLLALLGNEDTMEIVANVSVLLRLYVCGLVFIAYCYTMGKQDKLPVLMGTVAYVFSGFSIYCSGRQPFFITVLMTYEVLMLIGVERFIRERKYGVFVLSVFLQLFSGYYSAYINGLVLAVYLLIRLGCLYGKDIKRTVCEIGKLIGLYIWGAAMAAFTLLPSVLTLAGSSRETAGYEISLFYNADYFEDLLTGLNLEFGGAGYWTHVCMASIAWLACIVLFRRKGKHLRPYKIALAVSAVLLSCPVFGLIGNGFAYVCNRWCYAVALLLSLILVEMAPELTKLTKGDKGILFAFALAYSALVMTLPETPGRVKMIGIVLLGITALVILLQDQLLPTKQLRMAAMTVLTVGTAMAMLVATYDADLGGYSKEFQRTDTAYEKLSSGVGVFEETLEADDSFYRVAQPARTDNQSMALGYYGTASYFSVNPAGISDLLADVGDAAQYQAFQIAGLDERTALYATAAVKYYAAEQDSRIPYGFEPIEQSEDGEWTLYENQYPLSLSYSYTDYMDYDTYLSLSPVQRQQAMLECAVLTEDTDLLTEETAHYEEMRLDWQTGRSSGVTLNEEEKTINTEEDGWIELTFESQPNCETYLVLEGLGYKNQKSTANFKLYCSAGGSTSVASIRGKHQSYYFGRDGVAFNLGYSEEPLTYCKLSFNKGVKLVYEDIYIVSIPVEDYPNQVAQLRQVQMENVTERGDSISGTIEVEENRLLTFSVPYAEGWTAYVNGEKQEVLQVNVMYCGLLLEPGSYEIELRYELTGYALGKMISTLAVIAILPMAVISRRRKKAAKCS